MKPTWRVIFSSPLRGADNMALDEAILESVGNRFAPPTLRLYAWEPACLSLGYAQPISDIDLETLNQNGWDIVRRPTGGRAILHTDEITYSVTAPLDEPKVAGGVIESYRQLSMALLEALKYLGLQVQAEKAYDLPPEIAPKGPVCFVVPSNYEITVNGKKIFGSAQARRKDGVLQHGTLPLTGDISRITRVLKYPDPVSRSQAAQQVNQRATTVENVLQKQILWEQAAQALMQGFQEALNLDFVQEVPTTHELQRANELAKEKYGNWEWISRM